MWISSTKAFNTHQILKAKDTRALGTCFLTKTRREGSTLLALPCDCAADDLSHYDVTSEPAREVLMAAKI